MNNKFFQIVKMSVKGIYANKLRLLLTILGIVIGVATIVVVLSAGIGLNYFLLDQLNSFGTNTITIETRVPPTTRQRAGATDATQGNSSNQAVSVTTFKNRDINAIKQLSNINGAYGAVLTQKVVSYENVSKNVFIFGAGADRFIIDQSKLADGRYYSNQEDLAADQVAILGANVANSLFYEKSIDPIGKMIRVGNFNVLVIGVYEKKGGAGFSNDDDQVFMPLNTVQKKMLGTDYLFYGLAQSKDQKLSAATAEDIRAILRQNHNIDDPEKDDFIVNTQESNLDTFNNVLNGATFLLIAIACISLLVGGVGIMNIMYVSVTERISEIGLKKALGATSSDILIEFLVESILLTFIGGIVGVIVGAAFAYGVAIAANSFNFAWTYSIPVFGVAASIVMSMIIGLVFGVFPAFQASKMNPIDALRSE